MITKSEAPIYGFIRLAPDVHTLGIMSVAELLRQCGCKAVIAPQEICEAGSRPQDTEAHARLKAWLKTFRITRLGFSYRLDPAQGASLFLRWCHRFKEEEQWLNGKEGLQALYFAGLPEACRLVKEEMKNRVEVFFGDENPGETLMKLGVDGSRITQKLQQGVAYDDLRMNFAGSFIQAGDYLRMKPADKSGYPEYGTKEDTLIKRLDFSLSKKLSPLFRAHVGPFLPDRREAVKLFQQWVGRLQAAKWLDVLSIGTSQLSQSHFGENWGEMADGGGVPLNTVEELSAVSRAASPMLVRTYAGTRSIPQMARLFEKHLNMAWHALSFWWFNELDGRGPNSLRKNLEEHVQTLRFAAETNKPVEPNVPHHFAFRGADDATYVVSAVLAAHTIKQAGCRTLILQNMLNTPKSTWGLQDLAKSRAMLKAIRRLEDKNFRVILQPRAGLDYFSHDMDKARIQLAAVTALMADIEPENNQSPALIHVVSYTEGSHLADPQAINESIQITRGALEQYRKFRLSNQDLWTAWESEVNLRENTLSTEVNAILNAIFQSVPNPFTPDGLFKIFQMGFLPVPYLALCRDQYPLAVNWKTAMADGGVKLIGKDGKPMTIKGRWSQIGGLANMNGE